MIRLSEGSLPCLLRLYQGAIFSMCGWLSCVVFGYCRGKELAIRCRCVAGFCPARSIGCLSGVSYNRKMIHLANVVIQFPFGVDT